MDSKHEAQWSVSAAANSDQEYITCAEKAAALGLAQNYLARLIADGKFSDVAVRVNDKNEYLFQY